MTPERRKAVWMMVATFVAGIVIGSLVMGIFARQFYHGRGERPERGEMDRKRGSFTDKIYKVVEADSAQRTKMKPILDHAVRRIDDLEDRSNAQAYMAIDSMNLQLQPLLSEKQQAKLAKYLKKKRKSHEEEERREHDRDHGRH